ncbi:MAG: DUF3592 domain-containing protein [Chloroflexi bacterium]|nr:DUF3592 domain-containing protein [Chloroflexota bacterium]
MDEATLQIVFAIVCIIGVIFTVVLSMLAFAVPFVGVFGGLVWLIKKQAKEARAVRLAARSWHSTMSKVIKSRVEVSGGEFTSISPYVQYEYQVNNVSYSYDQIRAGDKFFASHTTRQSYNMIDKYPLGMEVEVFYNPDDPAEAALAR